MQDRAEPSVSTCCDVHIQVSVGLSSVGRCTHCRSPWTQVSEQAVSTTASLHFRRSGRMTDGRFLDSKLQRHGYLNYTQEDLAKSA